MKFSTTCRPIFAILYHFRQLFSRKLFPGQSRKFIFEIHTLQKHLVLLFIKNNTFRELTISPCPTALLIVILEWFRHSVMNDVAHIRLVYAHSKGNSGYNDIGLVIHPPLLNSFFVLFINICMVIGSFVSFLCQFKASLLAIFLTQTIDQSSLVFVSLYNFLYLLQNVLIFVSNLVK